MIIIRILKRIRERQRVLIFLLFKKKSPNYLLCMFLDSWRCRHKGMKTPSEQINTSYNFPSRILPETTLLWRNYANCSTADIFWQIILPTLVPVWPENETKRLKKEISDSRIFWVVEPFTSKVLLLWQDLAWINVWFLHASLWHFVPEDRMNLFFWKRTRRNQFLKTVNESSSICKKWTVDFF